MSADGLAESVVEHTALDWLCGLGWQVLHEPDIASDTPGAERGDYGKVVLDRRLRDALAESDVRVNIVESLRCIG